LCLSCFYSKARVVVIGITLFTTLTTGAKLSTVDTGVTALKFEGNEARIQEFRETDALDNGLAVQGHEVVVFAGAVGVVPDVNTGAEDRLLGGKVGLERVVVDAPVTVDGGLFTSHSSGDETGLGVGFTASWSTDIAGLPRLELKAHGRDTGLSDGEQGRGDESLSFLLELKRGKIASFLL